VRSERRLRDNRGEEEWWPTVRKQVRAGREGWMLAFAVKPPCYALTVITEKAGPSLVTQGCVGDKPCLVTVGTGAYVTVARPDVAAGWPERQPNPSLTLQTVSGEALPILKEAFLTLTLGRHPLKIWGFVADITNEFILGLEVLSAYDASVKIGRKRCVWQRKRYRYGAQGWDPSHPTW
jgi:hypothetical protein